MLNVPEPSPPVPQVSRTPVRVVRMGVICSRIAAAAPATSSTVSPLAASDVSRRAICSSPQSPLHDAVTACRRTSDPGPWPVEQRLNHRRRYPCVSKPKRLAAKDDFLAAASPSLCRQDRRYVRPTDAASTPHLNKTTTVPERSAGKCCATGRSFRDPCGPFSLTTSLDYLIRAARRIPLFRRRTPLTIQARRAAPRRRSKSGWEPCVCAALLRAASAAGRVGTARLGSRDDHQESYLGRRSRHRRCRRHDAGPVRAPVGSRRRHGHRRQRAARPGDTQRASGDRAARSAPLASPGRGLASRRRIAGPFAPS